MHLEHAKDAGPYRVLVENVLASSAAGARNVWIVGGGDLAGQLYDHGLLDELIVSIASVSPVP